MALKKFIGAIDPNFGGSTSPTETAAANIKFAETNVKGYP